MLILGIQFRFLARKSAKLNKDKHKLKMKYISYIIFFFAATSMMAQADNDVLFTVEDSPVYVGEFRYIYEKTNQGDADYSKESLEEYLELYKKFKLKVQRAKDIKLDTISSLKRELEGYRKQLANSYLIDKEVTERLMKEVYDRAKMDVNISHIMVQVPKESTPQDTLAKYNKIMGIWNQLEGGKRFEELVSMSEDNASKEKGGNIGFITAMLPNGFYNMETAAYTTPVNSYSKPFRTRVGYHIVKNNGNREARGQMEASHILIRTLQNPELGSPDPKTVIDGIYNGLKGGTPWEELVKRSEDKSSLASDGSLGKFGIGRFAPEFEDAVFSLAKDGDFSKPIQSRAGWHIVKRVKMHPQLSYKEEKGKLQNKIKKDSRYQIAQDAMLTRIKKDNDFKEYRNVTDRFRNSLSDEFTTYRWKSNPKPVNKVIFEIGEDNFILAELEEFLEQSSRKRQRIGRNGEVKATFDQLYNDYVKIKTLEYEEKQLEKKFPEFKYLMREYQEGILLFEATKTEIWDRASQDTLGLARHFETIKHDYKYQWKERAEVSFYSVKPEAKDKVNSIRKMTTKKSTTEVLEKYNNGDNKSITVRRDVFEKGKNTVIDALNWTPGALSEVEINKQNNSLNFLKIEKIIPVTGKTLKEARGYAVAQYQDHLESKWLTDLSNSYKIVVNQDILDKMIK